MQATDRPRSADRKERCGDELLDRYRRREYARRYKAEYTAGLTPQHLARQITEIVAHTAGRTPVLQQHPQA